MNEINNIEERYKRRKNLNISYNTKFDKFRRNELLKVFKNFIQSFFKNSANIKLLEVGAGTGGNVEIFTKAGLKIENIFLNELIDERFQELEKQYSQNNLFKGDVLSVNFNEPFDIVIQSTVFTSILDIDLKKKLAAKMFEITKNNGIIFWYDFMYNNPGNKDVKGIKKAEIEGLFSKSKKITYKKITLAPPIGRRIGNLYNFINFTFPFLRTHIVAIIEK